MTQQIKTPDEIWKEDVLGRRSDAAYLQNYLFARHDANPTDDGFVLAVNAEWGYGKSFLLERWKQDAEFQGHPAIYFDAWKNDFTPDPLLAFLSELEDGLTKHFKKIPIGRREKDKALRVLKKVLKPAVTIIAATAAKHITGYSLQSLKSLLLEDSTGENYDVIDDASKAVEEASKNISEKIKNALEPHKTIKESIKLFKENLKLLINHLETVQDVYLPILIFVDELDRCRPNYAIELLEGVKHLFGVPGVTFVVATNIPQLSESIKAVYGSGFDGQRYLQRFFDLQYTLSRPDNLSFCRLALEKISSSIPDKQWINYGLERELSIHPQQEGPYSAIDFVAFTLSFNAETFGLSLRDISQITTMLEACFISLKNERIHIFFLIFLASVYKLDFLVFKKLQSARSLHNQHGFAALLDKGAHVTFDVSEFNEFGQRNGNSKHSVASIAGIYLSNLERSNFNQHTNGFPYRNFDANDYHRLTPAGSYAAPFEKYFSIVEQAGGFITRKKS